MRNQAEQLASIGQYNAAIQRARLLVKLEPENAGYVNNLAWYLATNPKGKSEERAEAIKLAKQANKISTTPYQRAATLHTLMKAYEKSGNQKQEIITAVRALKLIDQAESNAQLEKLRQKIQKRIERYKQEAAKRQAS